MKVQYSQKDIQAAVDLVKMLDVPWHILNPIMVILMTKGQEIREPSYVESVGLDTVDRILAGGGVMDVRTITVPVQQEPLV